MARTLQKTIGEPKIIDHGWWYWDGDSSEVTTTALDTTNLGVLPTSTSTHTITHNLNIPIERQIVQLWIYDVSTSKWYDTSNVVSGYRQNGAGGADVTVIDLQENDANSLKLYLKDYSTGDLLLGGDVLEPGTDKYLIHIRELKTS